MTVTRIVQLTDGEELVSFEPVEALTASVLDDPRRGALERRGAVELTTPRVRPSSAFGR